MRCPTCGHENTDIARLCRDCGTSLFVDCPSCGHENTVASTFCAQCGEKLREVSPGGMGVGGAPAIFEVSRPAGFWIRFAASIIDTLPLLLVSALLAWLLFGENLFDVVCSRDGPFRRAHRRLGAHLHTRHRGQPHSERHIRHGNGLDVGRHTRSPAPAHASSSARRDTAQSRPRLGPLRGLDHQRLHHPAHHHQRVHGGAKERQARHP